MSDDGPAFELDLDDLVFPAPRQRALSRSVSRALRLVASAKRRQRAFQALAERRRAALADQVARIRGRALS